MCKLSTFTIYFIVALNNFLLVAICLNRTVAISQNAKSPTDPTTNAPARVKFLISAAIVCALIIALPIGVDIQEIKHPLLPHLAKSIAHYPELRDQHPRLCKDTWTRQGQLTYDILLIVTIYLIPLFVVCLSQHLVTVHLRQSQRLLLLMGHQNTVAWTRRRQRLTRLCVLMAVLFVLSWSPNHICNVLVKTFYVDNEVTQLLMDYSMCIAMSNAVTGPLLLIATCSVYWRFLKRFLLCSNNRDRISGPSTSVRSSLVMYCPGSQTCMLVNRVDGQQPKLEVAPHVMLSVTTDLENINLE
ncbi:hypothetical protein P879_00503 [Paragonimus westermani]|uniref:G-protein coupled receptors family 1 profile domain-containing protein n=1 Tax=Paragonimus westermani TaxID=34504 RepID=A0A8T0DUY0_9TREM|nr:hypothetical protein P879_00503 [Paragonimus westermani]